MLIDSNEKDYLKFTYPSCYDIVRVISFDLYKAWEN